MLFYYFCIAIVSLKVQNGLLNILYLKAKQISNLITNAMMIHDEKKKISWIKLHSPEAPNTFSKFCVSPLTKMMDVVKPQQSNY